MVKGQGDDYTTGCLLDYSYFKDYYKMIAIDLSKQLVLEEAKETMLDFSQGTVKVLQLNVISLSDLI